MHGAIELLLPYPPSANRYWRTDRGGKPHLSDEARAFRKKVKQRYGGEDPLTCAVGVTLLLHRPQRSGDLDNFLKVTLDALKGIAFEDDSQVQEIVARRYEDKANPRVVVKVWPLTHETETGPAPKLKQRKPKATPNYVPSGPLAEEKEGT